jgi:parallel beta-helix repeat protein
MSSFHKYLNTTSHKFTQIKSLTNITRKYLLVSYVLLITILSAVAVKAQPSGGPYGPIREYYQLPKVPGTIYYVAPDGKPDQTGESISNPTTIESAIERVKTGDAIVMRGGTYRVGNLVFNQGITIQPYQDEQPVFKGTYVAADWKDLGNGLWTTHWIHLFPAKPDSWWQRDRAGKTTPLYRFNNDMVFINGKLLHAVGWEGEVDDNTYYIDYDNGTVYIGVNPKNKLVEITAFNGGLIRTTKNVHGKDSDGKGFELKGIMLTQYAYRAIEIEGKEPEGLSPESEHGKDVIGTTLENCSITFCSRVAGYFRGDHLTIRNCLISDTRTEGIYIIGSSDVLLEKNIFTRNNIENITGYYPAAVKIFNQCYRATCRDNLIINLPYSNGVWFDVGNVDGRFIDNWVENVGDYKSEYRKDQLWPSSNGLFFEISKGVICAGNLFVNCDHGLMILNSSNAGIYQNTFVNSTACIGRNGRTPASDKLFGWHSSTGPDVDKREGHVFVNNLLTGDENFKRPLLFVWQADSICGLVKNPELKQLDYNMYVRSNIDTADPLILWSPANNSKCQLEFGSLESFQKELPEFESHSKYFPDYNGALFKSPALKNYQALSSFPGAFSAVALPSDVSKLLDQSKKFIGAYPPVK